jgi:hypothetical protein
MTEPKPTYTATAHNYNRTVANAVHGGTAGCKGCFAWVEFRPTAVGHRLPASTAIAGLQKQHFTIWQRITKQQAVMRVPKPNGIDKRSGVLKPVHQLVVPQWLLLPLAD